MGLNIFLYSILFIIGSLFGSFYTLAIYRIPKRQDITHTHSYCPNCNHKLGFWDLIPILSYTFLRGKCRYCKQKIRPRYVIIEILAGLLFVLMAFLMKIRIDTIASMRMIEYGFMVLYMTFIFLMAGMDKENLKIDKLVSVYGIIISIMYMVYLYIVDKTSIYRYGIYLIFYIIVLVLDTITLKKYAKDSYVIGILLTVITMTVFTGEYVTISTILFTLLILFLDRLIYAIKEKIARRKRERLQILNNLSIGFYLGLTNLILLLTVLGVNYGKA